jgi:hypothetical protein
MNQHIESFFKAVEQRLPTDDLISSKSLVDAGIVKSENTLARRRNSGYGPAFLRISKGQIRYIRSSVLEWLRQTHQPMFPFMYAPFKEAESCEVTNES